MEKLINEKMLTKWQIARKILFWLVAAVIFVSFYSLFQVGSIVTYYWVSVKGPPQFEVLDPEMSKLALTSPDSPILAEYVFDRAKVYNETYNYNYSRGNDSRRFTPEYYSGRTVSVGSLFFTDSCTDDINEAREWVLLVHGDRRLSSGDHMFGTVIGEDENEKYYEFSLGPANNDQEWINYYNQRGAYTPQMRVHRCSYAKFLPTGRSTTSTLGYFQKQPATSENAESFLGYIAHDAYGLDIIEEFSNILAIEFSESEIDYKLRIILFSTREAHLTEATLSLNKDDGAISYEQKQVFMTLKSIEGLTVPSYVSLGYGISYQSFSLSTVLGSGCGGAQPILTNILEDENEIKIEILGHKKTKVSGYCTAIIFSTAEISIQDEWFSTDDSEKIINFILDGQDNTYILKKGTEENGNLYKQILTPIAAINVITKKRGYNPPPEAIELVVYTNLGDYNRQQYDNAIESDDWNICMKIRENPRNIDNCISDIALKLNDKSICPNVPDEYWRGVCYRNFYENIVDPIECEMFTGSTKTECYSNLSKRIKNPDICSDISYQSGINWCLVQYVIRYKDESVCEKVVNQPGDTRDKNFCLWHATGDRIYKTDN